MIDPSTKFDEVTRKRVQQVAQASQEVSTKLWFLDLKFETFATPSLVGFAFLAWMTLCLFVLVCSAIYGLANDTALTAIGGILPLAILILLLTILVRVFFESLLIAFRISEHLKDIASAAKSLNEQRTN